MKPDTDPDRCIPVIFMLENWLEAEQAPPGTFITDDVLVFPRQWTTFRLLRDSQMFDREKGGSTMHVEVFRTNKYTDPVKAFAAFIGHPLFKSVVMYLEPSRPSTRKLLPWVQRNWGLVRVEFINGVMSTKFYINEQPLIVTEKTVIRDLSSMWQIDRSNPADIAHLADQVAELERFTTRVYMPIADEDCTQEILNNLRKFCERNGMVGFGYFHGNQPGVFVAHGPHDAAVRFAALFDEKKYTPYKCYVAPRDHRISLAGPGWYTPFTSLDLMRNEIKKPVRDFPLAYYPTGFLGEKRNDTLIDVAITLGALLPPYVLLEVADWLPNMIHFPHVRKIRRLERVIASMRKCGKVLEWCAMVADESTTADDTMDALNQ